MSIAEFNQDINPNSRLRISDLQCDQLTVYDDITLDTNSFTVDFNDLGDRPYITTQSGFIHMINWEPIPTNGSFQVDLVFEKLLINPNIPAEPLNSIHFQPFNNNTVSFVVNAAGFIEENDEMYVRINGFNLSVPTTDGGDFGFCFTII